MMSSKTQRNRKTPFQAEMIEIFVKMPLFHPMYYFGHIKSDKLTALIAVNQRYSQA